MDKTAANIKEKGHQPDKSEEAHCPHCKEHEGRLTAVEERLGMKKEPGVSKEESMRGRKRH